MYFARSAGRMGFQYLSNALRAARTARSTSASVPFATSASCSSVAGLIVANVPPPSDARHLPPIKWLYTGAMCAGVVSIEGAYASAAISILRDVVERTVSARFFFAALHEQIVQQRRRADSEIIRIEPIAA